MNINPGAKPDEAACALYGLGTVGDMIVQALTRFADRRAFVMDARVFTYREVAGLAAHAIRRFKALGLQRGDAIVQLTRNRPEHWVAAAAMFIAGFRSVALHALGAADDHVHIINDSGARVVLCDTAFCDQVLDYRARCPGVETWLCHDPDPRMPHLWGDQDGEPQPFLCGEALPDDIVRLAYTGGTTGRPKGVMLSSRSLLATAMLSLAEWDLPQEMRILCTAPISHGGAAVILPTLCRGGEVHILPGFEIEDFLDTIETRAITGFYAVPSMLYTLMDHPRAAAVDWSGVGFILYGGSPMSPSRVQEAIALFGPVLNQAYGQTEAPSCITLLRKADHLSDPARLLSCGLPYAGLAVAVLDEAGAVLPAGAIGEICVRGPHVMSGYWRQPELTAEAFRFGWLHTGDLAYADDDGYLFLVDRKKDLIISGGVNVYPKEVEDALMTHPAVAAAAVIGVPDPKWGEAVKGFVALRPGTTVEAAILLAHVKALKGAVNTPKTLVFMDAMPLTSLGKPDKKALRAPFWAGQERQIG